MKKVITNDNNLKENDITEIVKRVKVFLINHNNELLVCNSNNEYHLPGGHVEQNESLIDTLNREIEEETGIVLNINNIKPFACTIGYYKDWPEKNKNRKIEIYYYEIKTELKPNIYNTNLTLGEKEGNFNIKYIPLEKVEEVFINNDNKYGDKHGITKEMLKIFRIYKKYKIK